MLTLSNHTWGPNTNALCKTLPAHLTVEQRKTYYFCWGFCKVYTYVCMTHYLWERDKSCGMHKIIYLPPESQWPFPEQTERFHIRGEGSVKGEWQREWRGETGQFGRGGKETRKRRSWFGEILFAQTVLLLKTHEPTFFFFFFCFRLAEVASKLYMD